MGEFILILTVPFFKRIRRWSRVVQTLCNPGEIILTEEWTYPSALAASSPIKVKAAPVAVDGQGMRSDDLRKVLAEWDESARGAKRPHVMYTVPIGQNPTGGVGYSAFTRALCC